MPLFIHDPCKNKQCVTQFRNQKLGTKNRLRINKFTFSRNNLGFTATSQYAFVAHSLIRF